MEEGGTKCIQSLPEWFWLKQGLFAWHLRTFKAEYSQLHNKPNGLHEHSPNINTQNFTDMNFENNKTNGAECKVKLQ